MKISVPRTFETSPGTRDAIEAELLAKSGGPQQHLQQGAQLEKANAGRGLRLSRRIRHEDSDADDLDDADRGLESEQSLVC